MLIFAASVFLCFGALTTGLRRILCLFVVGGNAAVAVPVWIGGVSADYNAVW